MSDISEKIEDYHNDKIGLDELTQFMVGFEFKVPQHIESAPDDPNALLAFTEEQSYEQDDTWDEVNALFNLGWMSSDDYHHLHQAVYDAHADENPPEEKSGTRAGALLAWVRRRQRKFQDQLSLALQSRDPRAVARAQQGVAAWTKYRDQVEKLLSNPNMGFKSLAGSNGAGDALHELSGRITALSDDALGGDDHALSILPDLQEEMLERLVETTVDKSEVSDSEPEPVEDHSQVMKSLRSGLGFNDLIAKFGPDMAAELWREFHVNNVYQQSDAVETKSDPGLLLLLSQQTQLMERMYEMLRQPTVVNSNLVMDVEALANAILGAISPAINVQVPEQRPASIRVVVDTAPIADAIKGLPAPNVNVHPTIALPAAKTELTEIKLHRDADSKLDGAVSKKTTTFEEIAP